jgi:hypothetical protein
MEMKSENADNLLFDGDRRNYCVFFGG